MNTDTATLAFALLAILAQAAVASIVLLAVLGRFVPSVAGVRDAVFSALAPQAAGLAWAVAGACTAGSLYLSEVAGFVPCRLCWIQRGFMYPLVVVLGVLTITLHRVAGWVGLALAVLGGSVSTYHVLIERFPDLESTGTCDLSNPCSAILVEQAGYVTIPTMALSGFALIAALISISRRSPEPEEQ